MLFKSAVKAISKFNQIALEVFARHMGMGSPHPALQPSDDAMNIRKDLHCPLTTPNYERTYIEILR